tara:strand:+ start:1233 stop:1355 length:123 start_codon:yes stop_codon:yes gene_type:complete
LYTTADPVFGLSAVGVLAVPYVFFGANSPGLLGQAGWARF